MAKNEIFDFILDLATRCDEVLRLSGKTRYELNGFQFALDRLWFLQDKNRIFNLYYKRKHLIEACVSYRDHEILFYDPKEVEYVQHFSDQVNVILRTPKGDD